MIIIISNQKFIFPIAANVPAAKINESPGKNGKKTKPVSQKIIINNMGYIKFPYSWINCPIY